MKAARYYGAKDVRLEERPEPAPGPGEVKIEVAWCGLCGSDKSLYQTPFKNIAYPITPGHEFSGTVVAAGAGVTRFAPGQRVVVNPIIPCGACTACKQGLPNLCDSLILYGYHGEAGAFAQYTVVPQGIVVPIPDSLPFDVAAIVEPAAIALHALRLSRFKPGDSAVVFGLGAIGLLLAGLLRAGGAAKVVCVGHNPARRKLAHAMGATVVVDPDSEGVAATVQSHIGRGADVAFDAAGAQQTFALGLDVLCCAGELVVLSLPHAPLAFDARAALHRELSIKTSCCTKDEFPMVVELLAAGAVPTEGIITKKIHLDDIVAEGFECLAADKSQIKILVTPKRGLL